MPSSSLAFIPQQRSRIRHLLRSEKNDTTREQEKDSSQPFETILSLSVVVNEILERSRQRHLDLHVLKRELKKEIGSIDESLAEELSWEERIEKFAVWKRELWDALRTEKPPYWSLQTNKKRLFGNIRYYWKPRSVQYCPDWPFGQDPPEDPVRPKLLLRSYTSAAKTRKTELNKRLDSMLKHLKGKEGYKEVKKWSKALLLELKKTYRDELYEDNNVWDTVIVIFNLVVEHPDKILSDEGKILPAASVKSAMEFVKAAYEAST